MANPWMRALVIAVSLGVVGAGCGDDDDVSDLATAVDQAVPADLATAPDLSSANTDGGFLNADGGANCGAVFNYNTRYLGDRSCSANTGGAAGASCTTGADCAEVCCTCAGNSNQYMVQLCSDHVCNPDWACLCTNVEAKLKADNVCP